MTFSIPIYWFSGASDEPERRGRTRAAASAPRREAVANRDATIDRYVQLSVAEIVHGVRMGDERLFGRLFDAYWGVLTRFAALYTKSGDEAEDVTAQVFAALWQRRAEWRPLQGIELYLFGAVRNRARNLHRTVSRAERQRIVLAASGESPTSGEAMLRADNAIIADERRAILLRVVNSLGERPREVMLLRWLRGLEFDEIAALLDMSRNAVYVSYHRALGQLRERLPDYFK